MFLRNCSTGLSRQSAEFKREEEELNRSGMLNPNGDSSESELDINDSDWDSDYQVEWGDQEDSAASHSDITPVDESQWDMVDEDDDLLPSITNMAICGETSPAVSLRLLDGAVQPLQQQETKTTEEEFTWECSLCCYVNKLLTLRCIVCHTAAPRTCIQRTDGHRIMSPHQQDAGEINNLVRVSSAARADYDIANLSYEIEDMQRNRTRIKYEVADTESIDPTDLRLQCHRLASESTLCKDVHKQINCLNAVQLRQMRRYLIRSGIDADIYPSAGTVVEIPTTSGGWCYIFTFLDFQSLIRSAALVNRKWSELSRNPHSTTHLVVDKSITSRFGDAQVEFMVKRRWKHLVSIELGGSKISFPGLRHLLTACPLVHTLNISNCTNLQSKNLTIVTELPNLTSLDISYATIKLDTFQTVIKGCPRLEVLDITNCTSVGGSTAFQTLCDSGLRLTHLNMNGSGGPLTQLKDISQSVLWESLVFLDFSYYDVTFALRLHAEAAAIINALGANCRNLKFLALGKCIQMTDEFVRTIAGVTPSDNGLCLCETGCRNLMFLNISCARHLTTVSEKDLEHGCQKLKKVRLNEYRFFTFADARDGTPTSTRRTTTRASAARAMAMNLPNDAWAQNLFRPVPQNQLQPPGMTGGGFASIINSLSTGFSAVGSLARLGLGATSATEQKKWGDVVLVKTLDLKAEYVNFLEGNYDD